MALHLPDKWVWDFWFARRGDEHHVFYLQAPRSLGDSLLRHHNASVGHAVSVDACRWTVVEDALLPGPPGSWDDLAIWTGSVIERDGLWYMLYTGINKSEGGLIQRIGLATSANLVRWQKHPTNPVIEADERWYELLDRERWRDQSWRDPWLFEEDGQIGVLITARSNQRPPDAAGVIGRARSRNLIDWEVQPPLTSPGDFAQVECPQLVTLQGRRLILFSCLAEDHSAERRRRTGRDGETGTYLFEETDPDVFLPSDDPIAINSSDLGPLYAGKVLELEPGDWRYVAFRGAGNSSFLGELTDPLRLRFEGGEVLIDLEPTATVA
jgi:beta-fructofuranosidase